MIQSIPVKETREQLADLINQVAIGGKSFIITKFGKPKAMLVPVLNDKKQTSMRMKKLPGFGMWANRKEMRDPDKWVRNIRNAWENRYE